MADGAEIDGIVLLERVDGPLGQDVTRLQVPLAPEIKIGGLVGETLELGDRVQNLDRFLGHFWTCTISTDNGNFHCTFLQLFQLDTNTKHTSSRRVASVMET